MMDQIGLATKGHRLEPFCLNDYTVSGTVLKPPESQHIKATQSMNEDLANRMKHYEHLAEQVAMPLLPLMIRLDGRGFHAFCRGLKRPYDERLSALMVKTTSRLIEETRARMGYTQSDEITLVLYSENPQAELYFGGRLFKVISTLAGLASAYFNTQLPEFLPEKVNRDQPATFDCRAWSVPTLTEAANAFLWRELDATKNSINMAAETVFPPQELLGKPSAERQEMLFQRGINWNTYPAFFKRGTFVQRRKVKRPFAIEELDQLPSQHEVRRNPALMVERSEIRLLAMPPFSKVLNRVGVIFFGEDPLLESSPEPQGAGRG